MVKTFCSSGEREQLKGAVHGTACAIAAIMALYNGVAWSFRRESHLSLNALVYTLAVAWEVRQTQRHFRRCTMASAAADPPGPRLVA